MWPAGKPITVPPHIVGVGSIRYSSRTDYHIFCDNREHFKLCSVFRGSFNWLPGHLFGHDGLYLIWLNYKINIFTTLRVLEYIVILNVPGYLVYPKVLI